ncbi:MAG: hypothetical protein H0U95_14930 [Bacteroidetes bacterium]|nr:hypothetical protein [Bacteroidota bacterium]
MRKTILTIIIVSVAALYSCKKDKKNDPEVTLNPVAATAVDNYSSLDDFYAKNKVSKQTYTINTSTGGSFVTPNATTVNIPANAFNATGNVTIEFKDIYKKSDMLLSNMTTQMFLGAPLKSAGEFFIKAVNANNVAVAITPSAGINVMQPFLQPPDTSMLAFIAGLDTSGGNDMSWYNSPGYTLLTNATNYVFSLYTFNSPVDSGTWCNSDNASFFGAYPQTTLTLHANQTGYNPDVFLVFKNINSTVHVYKGTTDNFPYYYAPVGLECTVVAIGVNNGKLYSSFTPITIGANQTFNFNLSETTTESFKTSLKALD